MPRSASDVFNVACDYATGVIEGNPDHSNDQVKGACRAFLADLDRIGKRGFPYTLDLARITRFVAFAEAMPHIQGGKVGNTLRLEPWQLFFFFNVLGWVHGKTKRRRYAHALLECARKSGKTFLMSCVANEELIYGKPGAEIYSVATKRDQAALCWDRAGRMLAAMKPVIPGWKKTVTKITYKDRTYAPVSKEAKTLDGLNPTVCVIDEAAAIQDPVVFEVMASALGSAEDPLSVYISTAQYHQSETLYTTLRTDCIAKQIAGKDTGDVFGLFYGLDTRVTWEQLVRNEELWLSANPNLDVSVSRDWLRAEVAKADAHPSLRIGTLVKNFCRWTGATVGWIPEAVWDGCKADELYEDGQLYIGVDIARRNDLCAISCVWVRADGTWSFKHHAWSVREYVATLPDALRRIYEAAEVEGSLTICDEPVVPLDQVCRLIRELDKKYDVVTVGCDPYYSAEIERTLADWGIPMLRVGQSISKLTSPTRNVEYAVSEGNLRHGGSEFMRWQLRNVEVYVPMGSENIKLRKSGDHAKIDNVIALVIAAACIESGDAPEAQMDIATLMPDGTIHTSHMSEASGEDTSPEEPEPDAPSDEEPGEDADPDNPPEGWEFALLSIDAEGKPVGYWRRLEPGDQHALSVLR